MVGRVLETFCRALRVILGVLVAALTVPVAMQVISRYVGILPVYLWTEELATFIFIWIVMIGSMIAVWEGTHFDVQVLPDAKTPLGRLLQKGFVLVMISGFAILFAWFGVAYAQFGAIQNSVMMQVNLAVTYTAVPVAGSVWAVFALYRLAELVRVWRDEVRT